jgi:N-acetylmuramoyl-L-alanine amidase
MSTKATVFWAIRLQKQISRREKMNTQLVRLMVVSLVLGIAVLLGGAPDTAYAGGCTYSANQIVLYEHPNYQGTCKTLNVGDYTNPGAMGFPNDAASSIRVGSNAKAQLCEHDGFNGACEWFAGDDADFGNNAIGHDRTSSARVQTKSNGSTNCDGSEGAYVYEHPNYQGRCSRFTADSPNPTGWYVSNDAASSIRFVGNWTATLYEHDNYQGASSMFRSDDPDFGNDAIGHDRASSIRVQRGSGDACANIPSGQYCVEYYNNRDLSGSRVLSRNETNINYDWGSASPGNGINNDNCSARWRGRFSFDSGNYVFSATADDGIRVYVDGNLVIDAWRDQGATTYRQSRNMSTGEHEVKVEYYENGGGAVARVSWQKESVLDCSNQYRAEYFNNRSLSGSPTYVVCEGWPINHDWGYGGPGNGVGSDNFSARWTGRAYIAAGTYNFIARADDGIRVWLDDTLIIDGWRDQPPTEYRVTRAIAEGNHNIKVEYYENGGGAVAQFRWEKQTVNSCGNIPAGQYCAEYYNSRDLSGAPVLVRNEGNINYDWGNGSPGSGVNNDNFSARWRGRFTFDVANYTITARADDGIRVSVDGNLVIDAWRDQAATEYRQTRAISAGEHEIKVEYYENGGGAVAQVRWEKNASPDNGLRGKRVTLDPGHGWQGDPGATANGMQEKTIVLDIANRAKVNLEAYGVQVSMTRTGDETLLGLSYAAIRANQFNANLVVAIHANAGGGTGTESCYVINKSTSAASQRLATLLTQQVSNQLGLYKRGDFPENAGDRCARKNATGWNQLYTHDMNPVTALIETAFIDGPSNNDCYGLN